ncbi:MAG: Gx transporter family protein [Anaerotruncus sp.]|nr:Gx transporter family protein [Anaerotruncus sp.]
MKFSASRTALLGLLFALSLVLSLLEASISGLIPIPGIKLGLSNIVTMYCLFCLGKREAFFIAALKSLFVLLTRGVVGAAMSFCGGVCSVAAMLLLTIVGKGRFSYTFTSVLGGVSHNAGQIGVAIVLLHSNLVVYYLPILAISGVLTGIITGFLLERLLPHLNRLFH